VHRLALAGSALLFAATALHAQTFTTGPCHGEEGHTNSFWSAGHQERVCELRSVTLPARAQLAVAGTNGGIEVTGEDRSDIALEAVVVGVASSQEDAQAIVRAVKIDTDDTIHAEGPSPSGWSHHSWSVNFRLHVPRAIAAHLQTENGGLALHGLTGAVRATTVNGGLSLQHVAGDIHAETTNGGITVTLDGDGWRGAGLFAGTTNGSISVTLPEHYSAHLIASTTNGSVAVAFPMATDVNSRKHIDTDLGRGGATLHFQSVNGSIAIGR
jgi:hypothetical protein